MKLADSFQLHRFLAAAKEHVSLCDVNFLFALLTLSTAFYMSILLCVQITWCSGMQTNIKSGDLAKSVLEAEEQLEIQPGKEGGQEKNMDCQKI